MDEMVQHERNRSSQSSPAEPVFSFSKNSAEVVRASLTTFKGHRLADVRVWAQRGNGEYVPTRKGLSISVTLLDDLAAAVEALRAAVHTDGER